MKDRVHNSPNLIYSVGTQVVSLKQVQGSNGRAAHPAGAVGVVVRAPTDRTHSELARSTLPEQASGRAALNDLLVRIRLGRSA